MYGHTMSFLALHRRRAMEVRSVVCSLIQMNINGSVGNTPTILTS